MKYPLLIITSYCARAYDKAVSVSTAVDTIEFDNLRDAETAYANIMNFSSSRVSVEAIKLW